MSHEFESVNFQKIWKKHRLSDFSGTTEVGRRDEREEGRKREGVLMQEGTQERIQ